MCFFISNLTRTWSYFHWARCCCLCLMSGTRLSFVRLELERFFRWGEQLTWWVSWTQCRRLRSNDSLFYMLFDPMLYALSRLTVDWISSRLCFFFLLILFYFWRRHCLVLLVFCIHSSFFSAFPCSSCLRAADEKSMRENRDLLIARPTWSSSSSSRSVSFGFGRVGSSMYVTLFLMRYVHTALDRLACWSFSFLFAFHSFQSLAFCHSEYGFTRRSCAHSSQAALCSVGALRRGIFDSKCSQCVEFCRNVSTFCSERAQVDALFFVFCVLWEKSIVCR